MASNLMYPGPAWVATILEGLGNSTVGTRSPLLKALNKLWSSCAGRQDQIPGGLQRSVLREEIKPRQKSRSEVPFLGKQLLKDFDSKQGPGMDTRSQHQEPQVYPVSCCLEEQLPSAEEQ